MLPINLIKDSIKSTIPEDITKKLKTPFVLTFVLVWVIMKRVFLYDLFLNKTADKRELLINHLDITSSGFYIDIFKVAGFSFLALIIFYFLLNISRIITLFSEERVKLNLLNSLESKSVTAKKDVDIWKAKVDECAKENKALKKELDVLQKKMKKLNI